MAASQQARGRERRRSAAILQKIDPPEKYAIAVVSRGRNRKTAPEDHGVALQKRPLWSQISILFSLFLAEDEPEKP